MNIQRRSGGRSGERIAVFSDVEQQGRPDDDESDAGIEFEKLLAIFRRQWRVVFAACIFTIALGTAYLITAVPKYTAAASLLIDTGNQKIVDQLSAVSGVLGDESSVLSQVEILKSEKIAQAVAETLNLSANNEFMSGKEGPIGSLVTSIRSYLRSELIFSSTTADTSDETLDDQIVDTLISNLKVQRLDRTYVLELSYTSAFPELAANITKAYAEAYLTDQLDSKYDATRRASDWLQKRIAELRQKSLETDMAVQRFRAEKGLITTDGQLITDQQLTQLNSQLIIAQADTSNAEARYKRIMSIVESGELEGAVTDALQSEVITDLRRKFLESSRKEADISSRLGEKHVQAVRLRNEMSEYRRLMFEELTRIAQTYQSSYQVAKTRQENLERQVVAATKTSASANDQQVQLRELEREADTYKNLYQTFLQRYQEAVQQQSFPVTEARIISRATIPRTPSSPKAMQVFGLSIFLGLMAGAGIGVLREFRDRFFRTGDQVRRELDLEFLGTVPLEASKRVKLRGSAKTADISRSINKLDTIGNYVVDHPLSSFAESMRSAKIAVDVFSGNRSPKIIGIVSVLPGEGKSTISINFAELLANQGSRVLLIDGDLRNPGATRQLAQHADRGIVEALQDDVPLSDLVMTNAQTGLAFLPAVIKRRIPYSAELLSSEAMDRLLAHASRDFDYIVIDLPPLAPVVDARAISAKMDAYIFVVEWGGTARNVVAKALLANAVVAAKCAGVILNKVDSTKMKLYQSYGSSEYYSSRYVSYYRQ